MSISPCMSFSFCASLSEGPEAAYHLIEEGNSKNGLALNMMLPDRLMRYKARIARRTPKFPIARDIEPYCCA